MFNPWLDLSFKAFQLGLEAQSVVTLRMMRLASGGSRGQAEASRMVSEKAVAAVEAQVAATAAALAGHKDHVIAGKALKVFTKRVRANKRRLSHR
jgi:hypothetical protein